MPRLELKLYKENFKFSAAHFLIFDSQRAERLHGHNYKVQLGFEMQPPSDLGYTVDFSVLKKLILKVMAELDEYVLLPAQHPEIKTRIEGATLHLQFRDRTYAFPANEVKLLPIKNTSVEEYSSWIAETLRPELKKLAITAFSVTVEETSGQAAVVTLQL